MGHKLNLMYKQIPSWIKRQLLWELHKLNFRFDCQNLLSHCWGTPQGDFYDLVEIDFDWAGKDICLTSACRTCTICMHSMQLGWPSSCLATWTKSCIKKLSARLLSNWRTNCVWCWFRYFMICFCVQWWLWECLLAMGELVFSMYCTINMQNPVFRS